MPATSLPHRARNGVAALLLGLLAAGIAPARRADAQAASTKPTVAVLYFTNGAIGKTAEYAPLSKGLAEMLITEMAANTNIRVVERDRLQALLEEQNLGNSGRVEKETAAKIGKTLGALHMLMGSFVIDPKERMRLDVRAINTETSELEYATSITGKADNMLELLGQLGTKLNQGLKLPAVQSGFQEGVAVGAKGPNQFKSMMLLSRALEQQDRKNNVQAVALIKESLQANPENARAKTLLASLEKGAK
jgi:TolB-like protein|eukprot:TRINITY_DN98686_c0_g1_i1.p1 TRINITY_DN98686_c0_g1~~TRINITY_DN98686_c0_g1_i1.p1  ORF type:complete len:249 (+),score=62.50 TRINITY_DN98686_c0_g1_i1:3-749(+)